MNSELKEGNFIALQKSRNVSRKVESERARSLDRNGSMVLCFVLMYGKNELWYEYGAIPKYKLWLTSQSWKLDIKEIDTKQRITQ